jgi:hypothetical protein
MRPAPSWFAPTPREPEGRRVQLLQALDGLPPGRHRPRGSGCYRRALGGRSRRLLRRAPCFSGTLPSGAGSTGDLRGATHVVVVRHGGAGADGLGLLPVHAGPRDAALSSHSPAGRSASSATRSAARQQRPPPPDLPRPVTHSGHRRSRVGMRFFPHVNAAAHRVRLYPRACSTWRGARSSAPHTPQRDATEPSPGCDLLYARC